MATPMTMRRLRRMRELEEARDAAERRAASEKLLAETKRRSVARHEAATKLQAGWKSHASEGCLSPGTVSPRAWSEAGDDTPTASSLPALRRSSSRASGDASPASVRELDEAFDQEHAQQLVVDSRRLSISRHEAAARLQAGWRLRGVGQALPGVEGQALPVCSAKPPAEAPLATQTPRSYQLPWRIPVSISLGLAILACGAAVARTRRRSP